MSIDDFPFELTDVRGGKPTAQLESMIKVIGVGGGGCNAVNQLYERHFDGVDLIVCNTDLQALMASPVPNKIQIGQKLTEGRGAGSVAESGRQSAIETLDYIKSVLGDEKRTRMLFVTAGMGGGTGTGAAPVIAKTAKEMGILTVGVVTIPFNFEGATRIKQAMDGVEELERNVDALLVVCNERLSNEYGSLRLSEAFKKVDNILATAVQSIAEIITLPAGYVNIDFQDVRRVLKNSGVALMGAGESTGEGSAMAAVSQAVNTPLLNSNDIRGASNVIINYIYNERIPIQKDLNTVNTYINRLAGSNCDVIWGTRKDSSLRSDIRIVILAVGFNPMPIGLSSETAIGGTVEETDTYSNPQTLFPETGTGTSQAKPKEPKVPRPRSPRRNPSNPNEIPDVSRWFNGLFSNLFDE